MYQGQINPDNEVEYEVCIHCGGYQYDELVKQYCIQVQNEYVAEYGGAIGDWRQWRYEAIELITEKHNDILISCFFCNK